MINIDSVNIDLGNLKVHTARMADSKDFLTAREAAARLGVKQQTIYAYVSRGLLTRQLSLDGRTSLYDPQEITELRSARRRTTSGEVTTVISSSITKVDEAGHLYRGVPAASLLGGSFEDAVTHLWGHSGSWEIDADLLSRIRTIQDLMPQETPLIDRLRMSVNIVSAHDVLRHDPSPSNHCHAGRMMLTAMVDGLPQLSGHSKPSHSSGQLLPDRLWGALTATPATSSQRDCLKAALILLADHGLAASTFAARLAASVRADPYSVVLAGMGAVGGPLHGAASAQVHRLLDEAAEIGAQRCIGQRLANNEKIPGIGHLVYRTVDPREVALSGLISNAWADDHRLQVFQDLRSLLAERLAVPANVDFALAGLTWLANMTPEAGQCIFVARTAGWIAHGIEEFGEQPIRFRPVARWVPDRPALPEDNLRPD